MGGCLPRVALAVPEDLTQSARDVLLVAVARAAAGMVAKPRKERSFDILKAEVRIRQFW